MQKFKDKATGEIVTAERLEPLPGENQPKNTMIFGGPHVQEGQYMITGADGVSKQFAPNEEHFAELYESYEEPPAEKAAPKEDKPAKAEKAVPKAAPAE